MTKSSIYTLILLHDPTVPLAIGSGCFLAGGILLSPSSPGRGKPVITSLWTGMLYKQRTQMFMQYSTAGRQTESAYLQQYLF